MSREYTIDKIKEALHITRGNSVQARQQVAAWAMSDPKLLKELAKPHLTGIVAHAVGRVVSGKADEPLAAPATEKKAELDNNDSFGMDILKAIAGGGTAQFGQEGHARPLKKQGVSQRHLDAIQQLVQSAQSKKTSK